MYSQIFTNIKKIASSAYQKVNSWFLILPIYRVRCFVVVFIFKKIEKKNRNEKGEREKAKRNCIVVMQCAIVHVISLHLSAKSF